MNKKTKLIIGGVVMAVSAGAVAVVAVFAKGDNAEIGMLCAAVCAFLGFVLALA